MRLMRFWMGFAAVNGFLAVLAGALGAHLLASRLSPRGLEWLATAERYQMWHALALALVAVLAGREAGAGGRWLHAAAIAFALGIVLFSGALYVLALTGWRPVAMVAPFGGLAMMAGWALLAAYAALSRSR